MRPGPHTPLAGLALQARHPPPPSPPPGSAAASSREQLPWPEARWAAGTPLPPARARAKVREAGGWLGPRDSDGGAVGSPAGRAVPAGEAGREAAGRKGAGTRGRESIQPPRFVPLFGTGADRLVLQRPKGWHFPPCGGDHGPDGNARRAILLREGRREGVRGALAAGLPGSG